MRLTVAYEGDEGDLAGAVVTDNGSERPLSGDVVPLATTGASRAVVIAVDTSEAMDPVMADIRDSVTAVVEGLPGDVPVGIVTFADRVVPVRALTTDRARILDTISQLQANGESVLWDGIAGSAELLATDAPDAQPSVVVVTGSGNLASVSTSGDAVGALRNAGAPAYIVGLEGARLDTGGLEDVVERAGGRLLTTGDSEALDEMGTTMAATVDQQYVLAYEPPTGDEAEAVADIQVQVGDSTTAATFVRGSESDKPADLFAEPPLPVHDGLLQSDLAKFVGVGLILLAAALGAFALIMLTQRDTSHLTNVLQPYSEGFVDDSSIIDDDADGGLAKTALIQRAVEMTGDFAERQGFLAAVEAKLERADLPLRAAEALFFYASMVAVVGLLSLVLLQNLVGTIVITVLAIMIPKAAVNFKAKRRLKKFNNQLPDMLAAPLRDAAGRLLPHAGRRGRVPGSGGPDRLRAASGRDRVPSGPAARRSARRGRGADGQRGLPVGRHGHRDPARSRREPGGAADDGVGDHDGPGAAAPGRRCAHGGRQGLGHGPRAPAPRPRRGHVRHQPGVHRRPVQREAREHACWAARCCSPASGSGG